MENKRIYLKFCLLIYIFCSSTNVKSAEINSSDLALFISPAMFAYLGYQYNKIVVDMRRQQLDDTHGFTAVEFCRNYIFCLPALFIYLIKKRIEFQQNA